jgi:CubicO group peptidase (beta-lactamase class C family)
MPRFLLVLALCVGAAAAPGCAGRCTASGSPEGQPLGFMAQYAADVCIGPVGGPAVTVTISVDDATLGLGAAGALDDGSETDPMTPFRLGAVSEVYTAALLARLSDMGRVDLADPVTDYLPWAATDEPISLRQLLTHRSGLKDAYGIGALDLSQALGPETLAREAIERGTRFSPGDRFAESATDYLLLGLVVEAELSQDYGLALHQLVLDPFGLGATFVEPFEPAPASLPGGHDGAGRPREAAFDPANSGGASGVISNGTDIERFLRLLFEDDTFLSEVMQLEVAFPADGEAGDEGFGFGVSIDDWSGEPAWSRTGSHVAGYGSAFVYLPERRVASVALTNARPSRPGLIADLAAEYGADFLPTD